LETTLGAYDKWSGQTENGVEKELQDTNHEGVDEDAETGTFVNKEFS
jgi:hypothetical protein